MHKTLITNLLSLTILPKLFNKNCPQYLQYEHVHLRDKMQYLINRCFCELNAIKTM